MVATIEELKNEHRTQLMAMKNILNKKEEKLREVEEENEKLELLVVELSKATETEPFNEGLLDKLNDDVTADVARYFNAILSVLAILFDGEFTNDEMEMNLNSMGSIIINSLLFRNIYEETSGLSEMGASILAELCIAYEGLLRNTEGIGDDHLVKVDLFNNQGKSVEFSLITRK